MRPSRALRPPAPRLEQARRAASRQARTASGQVEAQGAAADAQGFAAVGGSGLRSVERLGWSVGGLLVVFWGLRLWTGSLALGWLNPVAVLLVLAGLLASVGVWAARRPPGAVLQGTVMALLAAGLLLWGYLQVVLNPGYGTDEVAFGQYAAQLLLDGANPYLHSMLPSFQEFSVPAIYHTYLLDGSPVTSVSYPALAFLLYLPALALGLHMQAAILTDLVAWVVAFALLWRLLPRRVSWAAGLLMSLAMYVGFVVGGVNDALFVPFVFLAVWRWDRYGDEAERTLARWIGPVALGLAMAVKQTPWFLLPFLLVGIGWEARARGARWLRTPLRYSLVAGTVFFAVNEPFIVADPGAWAAAVLTPLLDATVPSGQGLINLALFERVGGVLVYYKLTAAVALAGALLAYALYYPRLKRAWVPLVALVFFWPSRSFASYLIDLAPAALLAATTVRPAQELPALVRRVRAPAVGAVGLAFAASLALALVSRPPLELSILATRTTGQHGAISGIEVEVRNTSGRMLRPHFTVVKGGYLTSFWYPLGRTGPPALPPHSTRRLFLRAPNTQSMPSLDGGFVLEAFTRSPATVSASRVSPPSRWRLVLSPDAVDRPVPVGTTVYVTVRLTDRLGERVRRAGVPVSLGQVVYGQYALIPGQASINGFPEGRTPVTQPTNAGGEVRFAVRGVQAQSDPVFFQAWIAARGQPPRSYSNLLSVQFVERRQV